MRIQNFINFGGGGKGKGNFKDCRIPILKASIILNPVDSRYIYYMLHLKSLAPSFN